LLLVVLFSVALHSAIARAQQTSGVSRPPRAGHAHLAELLEQAERESLHEDRQWLALLHYERRLFPLGPKSHALTSSFFLSEQGAHDAAAELRATLTRFFEPVDPERVDEHPQCVFAARRHWLGQRLEIGEDELPRISCPDFERWRDSFGARGLSLIFPEEFMSNPASVFGHTLLRIDVAPESGTEEILGYALDFTANTGEDGGLTYMFKGALGFYPAAFGVRPYFDQLKRYSDWENRDIWEYRLAVDEEQLGLLLMHLWELQDVEFPYYFFTKNCSYELLRLLEVALPGLHASDEFHGAVLPIASVRAVAADPNRVKGTRYRASPSTRLRANLRTLSRAERKLVRAIVGGESAPDSEEITALSPARRSRVLDVAYDQLRYAYLAGLVDEEESRPLSRQILIARSKVDVPPSNGEQGEKTDEAVSAPSVRPDQGHESWLFGISGGWRDDEAFIDLRLRPAFHAFMDNSGGYPESVQIRILDTRMRIYPESGRVRLQELTLVEATSLSPRSEVFKPMAWSFGTGQRTRRLPGADGLNGSDELEDSSVWSIQFAAGLAWDPAPGLLVYALADLRLDAGPDLEDNVSFGPGARLGLYAGGADSRWRTHLFGEVTRFALGDTTTWARSGAELRYSTSRNTALTVDASARYSYGHTWFEGGLQVSLFF
jgi:hypothetical protein